MGKRTEEIKRTLFCGWLDWHSPSSRIGFDGCSLYSTCKNCGEKILKDSNGDWFGIERNKKIWKNLS
jgi:hypothetical protein